MSSASLKLHKAIGKAVSFLRKNSCLVLTVLVAVIFRFSSLTLNSYWFDELGIIVISDPARSLSEVYDGTSIDIHPPLYHLILWGWYQIFGFTEFAGRFLSALFGSLLVPSLYVLGKEMYGQTVGKLAALFASFNFFFIYYAHENRSYSLLALLTTISFIFFVKDIREKKKFDLFVLVLTSFLLVNVHYFGFIVVGYFALYWLCSLILKKGEKRGGGQLLSLTSVVIISILYRFETFYNNLFHSGDAASWIEPPRWKSIFNTLLEFFGSNVLFWSFSILLCAFLIAVLYKYVKCQNQPSNTLTLSYIATVFLFPFLFSLYVVPIYTTRNMIIALPLIMIACAYVASTIKFRYLRAALIVLFILLSSYIMIIKEQYFTKVSRHEQWRELARGLVKGREHCSDLYAEGQFRAVQFNIYFRWLDSPLRSKPFSRENIKEQNHNCFWILRWKGDFANLSEKLSIKYKKEKRLLFRGVNATLFTLKDDSE